MVGLPFPNLKSPELQERMNYLNSNVAPCKDGRSAGQVLYVILLLGGGGAFYIKRVVLISK